MLKKSIAGILSLAVVMTSFTLPATTTSVKAAANSSNGTNDWTIVWSDEFNGTSVDTSNWTFEIGNGDSGWGNNELEYYTNRTDNAYVSGGSLHIIAKRENYNGYKYTSARMKTQNKQIFKYGKIESRIKFTNSMQDAMWPAFWMLGNDITSVGWPSCGEIDIFEHANSNTHVGGTFHWTGQWGYQYSGGNSQSTFGDNAWHTYAVEWYEDCIKWYLDGNNYYTLNTTNSYMDEAHKQHFILLNFAIGGPNSGYTGNRAVPSSFTSAEMEVDYVRVYQGSDSAFLYNNQAGMGGTSTNGWTNNGTWSVFQGSAINWTTAEASMTGGQNLDSFAVQINNSGSNISGGMWAVQAKASDISVTPDVTNRISFNITSDKAKTVWILAENNDETKFLDTTAINLAAGTNTYTFDFTPTEDKVNLIFAMGYDSGDVAVAGSSANISVDNFKIGAVSKIPGTVSVDSYAAKTNSITFSTESGITYAGNLNNGSYLDYFVDVAEAGDYTINLKLAAGNAQYNAKNMLVKINNSTIATLPVQASSSWTTFVDHTTTVHFPSAGAYTISVAADSGACNVTDFTLTKNAVTPPVTEKPTEAQTTSPVTGEPSEVFGQVIESNSQNTITVVWGRNSEMEEKGQLYNVYIDDVKKLSSVACGSYTIDSISPGEHTVKITSVYNGAESQGVTGTVNVAGTVIEETTTKPTSVKLDILGYQVSATAEGFRTIYTIDDPDKESISKGIVYGLNDVSESELVVGSTNSVVYSYEATDTGKIDTTLGSSSSTSESYAMTMKFIKTAEFYNTKINVRAYAKLSDGSYVYSDTVSFSVYELADYVYQNNIMSNMSGHNYLYTDILKIVNPSYEMKDFIWKDSLAKPDFLD